MKDERKELATVLKFILLCLLISLIKLLIG